MMPINVGDTVYCRIKDVSIVSLDKKWEAELPFKVVGVSPDEFYILYVPKYYNIRHSWKIENVHARDCNINKIYIGSKAVAIPLEKISKVIRKTPREEDGMVCLTCKKFYYMAESNQPDGTLKCYTCRSIGL